MRKLFKHTSKDTVKGTKERVEVYFAKVCAKDCDSCSFLIKKPIKKKMVKKHCVFKEAYWEEIPRASSRLSV